MDTRTDPAADAHDVALPGRRAAWSAVIGSCLAGLAAACAIVLVVDDAAPVGVRLAGAVVGWIVAGATALVAVARQAARHARIPTPRIGRRRVRDLVTVARTGENA